jgi:hypothetical protein
MRRTVIALAAMLLLALGLPQAAGAETTHRYIKDLALPVSGAQLMGVDPQGNIVLLAEGTVRKFSSAGDPVAFSALGTSVIDGAGGGDCPATPADCDETPWNSLGNATVADMNQSQLGPTAGYMYVAATNEVAGVMRSQIVVFDSTGAYRGQIDTTQPTPAQSPEGVPSFLSVSPGGASVILTYQDAIGDDYHADKYQAVDADPAHHAFVGQLRKTSTFGSNEMSAGGFGLGTVADDEVVYVGRGSGVFGPETYHPIWQLYDAASFGQAQGDSEPVNLDPGGCTCDTAGPWGDGGRNEESGGYFESVSINPADHHAFLLNGPPGTVEEWASPTEQVGPSFGSPETIGFASGQLAFDTSDVGSTSGRIYLSKGSSLAVMSPPVPIPDIEGATAVVGHDSATVTATVDLDHGPKVTDCRVQWGEFQPEQPVFYSQSIPCVPGAPFEVESTDISAEITGLQPEASYRARVVVKTNNGVNRSDPIVVRPRAVLGVETGTATDITKTTAVLNGSLDPDGIATTYWFQYGIDTQYRQRTAEASAGEGTGSISVAPTEIENLQPGRLYHFALVAQNSLGITVGPDQTFIAAAPPAISGVRPSNVAETSATLNARIDPGGFETTYRFEYGPSAEYGSVAPVGGGSAGSGTSPVPVSVDLAGLEPGVTYHFRVVATNQWGTAITDDGRFNFFPEDCPNSYVRQLTNAAYLPDCRAYELVIPRSTGAVQLYPGDVIQDLFFFKLFGSTSLHFRAQALNLGTATSPSRFSFIGLGGQVAGTNPPNSLADTYTSTRTLDGWVTRYWGQRGNEVNVAGGARCNQEMDLCIDYRLREPFGIGNDPNETASNAPYVWDEEGNSLGRWPTNLGVVKGGDGYVGDDEPSPDFSHYVFSSVNVPFTRDGITKSPGTVYDNDVDDATVTKASVLPGGADIPAGEGGGSEEEFLRIPAVSTDGSHILMSTQGTGGVNLYMRVDGSITYPIAAGKKFIKLIGMTNDGEKVVFSSRDQVTPDDTDIIFNEDIFVWEETGGGQITRVSQGNGAGNENFCQPSEGLLCSAIPLKTERPDSDDAVASQAGDVYFYSPEQLDPAEPGVPNEKNLYVFRQGAVRYVATLEAGTAIDRIQISPDGRHVAFLTAAKLTSYDNQGWRQMYTFDPETGVIRCASCLPSGEPPQVLRPAEDPGSLFPEPARVKPSKDVMASQSGRFMADDGKTVFATSDALVGGDTNGLVDVYLFSEGRPQLVSSGTASTDHLPGALVFPGEYTGVEAISRNGVDIYFSTFDTLAPHEDFNGQFLKFYDARVNGGFVPPPARLPCVAADECHGDEAPGRDPAVIDTTAVLGTPAAGKRKAAQKQKQQKRKKKRKKKSQRKKRRANREHANG